VLCLVIKWGCLITLPSFLYKYLKKTIPSQKFNIKIGSMPALFSENVKFSLFYTINIEGEFFNCYTHFLKEREVIDNLEI